MDGEREDGRRFIRIETESERLADAWVFFGLAGATGAREAESFDKQPQGGAAPLVIPDRRAGPTGSLLHSRRIYLVRDRSENLREERKVEAEGIERALNRRRVPRGGIERTVVAVLVERPPRATRDDPGDEGDEVPA